MLGRGKSPGFAKLSCPRLDAVHPRERLFRRLDECLEHSAVWVCGVPGAGKTTLVASYLNGRRLQAQWYRADNGDTDPVVTCATICRSPPAGSRPRPTASFRSWRRYRPAISRLSSGASLLSSTPVLVVHVFWSWTTPRKRCRRKVFASFFGQPSARPPTRSG